MDQTAALFQSLADVTRLRILALLLAEQELCVCDLMAVLQLPQSTVSRHLAHLKNAGWLRDRREAVWSYYAVERSLSPLQQALLPAIDHFLRSEPLAQSDRLRLKTFNREGHCG